MRLLATLIVLLVVGLSAPAASAGHRAECRYQGLQGGHWTDREVKATIKCVTHKYNLNTDLALKIASHESGFEADADNGQGYCGVFQHAKTYFPGRLLAAKRAWPHMKRFGAGCYNARSNIFAAAKLAKATGGWYEAWCKWASYC